MFESSNILVTTIYANIRSCQNFHEYYFLMWGGEGGNKEKDKKDIGSGKNREEQGKGGERGRGNKSRCSWEICG